MTPNDPFYTDQWHFDLMGDVETIWNEYTGVGVHVGIYDDGVDYTHEDLDGNYDSSLHAQDEQGSALDPFPALFVSNGDGHGTSVAGLIAAENNGSGGVGVASGATITGVNIFDPDTYGFVNGDEAALLDVAGQATKFDISQNSWGASPFFISGLTDGSFADQLDAVYGDVVALGRGGLGTIITQAAGNDDMDANGDGLNASRFTITVAATDSNGDAAYYSNYGSSILVAAPAAAVTTDLTGGAGYDPTDYTTEFGGTSAATPVVSGVVALMLDANAGLGWRDVQDILAASASLTGIDFDATEVGAEEEGLWQTNGSDNWNGGGYHIHTNYGYGMVNIYNAVRMAEVWGLFGAAESSANELLVQSGINDFDDVTLTDLDPTGVTKSFVISGNLEIDHVALHLDIDSGRIGDLLVTLTSAEGTDIVVALDARTRAQVDGEWIYGIEGLRGEFSAGTWAVTVADVRGNNLTTLRSASIDVYGSAASTDDVYHITDEYLVMLGNQGSRGTVTETDGGTDWMNMAAVAGDILLNMWVDGDFWVEDVLWGDLAGVFENAVTGDGNDEVYGNEQANQIHGMRGDDLIRAGRGNDVINGGAGNDWLLGGDGDDTAIGGSGTDTLGGGLGNDMYIWDGVDIISEAADAGIDTVKSQGSVWLAANVEHLTMQGESAISGNGNEQANILRGNSAGNSLFGSLGNDKLIGNDGNDALTGGGGHDEMIGGFGADTFRFVAGLGSSNVDEIVDFSAKDDQIHLDDAVFAGLVAGKIANGAFTANNGGKALEANDRIIYEKDTGALYFDRDGTGSAAAVKFAELDAGLVLTSADFFVI